MEPERKRRRTRRGSLIAPEEPGEQITREEFQELVRDLDIESERGKPEQAAEIAAETQQRTRAGVAQQQAPASKPQGDGVSAPERDPTADLTPEDLVLKDEPRRREKRRAGGKRRKHGRSR